MTNDLKERLLDMGGGEHAVATCHEAAAYITDLEARLAAAEAGEDALAADLRRFRHTAALAAYEARRKG